MKLRPMILAITAASVMSSVMVMAADSATPAAASTKAPESAKAAESESTTVATSEKPAKAKKPACEGVTASRIQASPGHECRPSAAPTRTYTQEELSNTGETNIADALRKLDPSIR